MYAYGAAVDYIYRLAANSVLPVEYDGNEDMYQTGGGGGGGLLP